MTWDLWSLSFITWLPSVLTALWCHSLCRVMHWDCPAHSAQLCTTASCAFQFLYIDGKSTQLMLLEENKVLENKYWPGHSIKEISLKHWCCRLTFILGKHEPVTDLVVRSRNLKYMRKYLRKRLIYIKTIYSWDIQFKEKEKETDRGKNRGKRKKWGWKEMEEDRERKTGRSVRREAEEWKGEGRMREKERGDGEGERNGGKGDSSWRTKKPLKGVGGQQRRKGEGDFGPLRKLNSRRWDHLF